MEECGEDQAPPGPRATMKGNIFAQAEKFNATHAAEQANASSRMERADQADAEHKDVDDEDDGSDGGVAAEEFGKAFAPRGEGEAQAGAAFVAAISVDANERAARGAKLRSFFAGAAKHAAKDLLPAGEAQLPMIGKGQPSSLRACNCIPIIPEIRRAIRRRGAYGQIRGVRAEAGRRNHAFAEVSGRRSSAHNRKAHGAVSARSFRQAVGSGKETGRAGGGAHTART